MRSSFAAVRGGALIRTPNARRQAARRRIVIVCAVLALALASGLVGSLIRPAETAPNQTQTGPFSYFPGA